MKLLVTTNGRLFQTPNGIYYSPIVYDYSFFTRYLDVFDSVRLVAHVAPATKAEPSWLKVNGPGLEIFPVVSPKGKIGYIKNYLKIKKSLRKAVYGCDAANLRIPDELAFQLYDVIRKYTSMPVGVEVNSNSWDFFSPGSTKGLFRPFLRRWWNFRQKMLCKGADASCYVTKNAIQQRYRPSFDKYTTYCSDVDIEQYANDKPRQYGIQPIRDVNMIHVSGSVSGRAKGHKELVEAIVKLQNIGYTIHCTLVGKGKLDKDIQTMIDIHNLDVVFSGTKNAQEIRNLFLTHDFFVFPSYREGLPRVVVEAMASGIMVVATSLDGIKELLPEKTLVPVKDSDALSETLDYYLQNPAEMTLISEINKLNSEEYRKSSLVERRIEFYETLHKLANENKR